jgi:hypothetical protein
MHGAYWQYLGSPHDEASMREMILRTKLNRAKGKQGLIDAIFMTTTNFKKATPP